MSEQATQYLRPRVTREEFDRLECNRCGDCCEAFVLPPLYLIVGNLEGMSAGAALARGDATVRGSCVRPLPAGIKPSQRDVRRPPLMRLSPDSVTWRAENDARSARWLAAIEPVEDEYPDGRQRYRCPMFARADDGTGACTIHDERPLVCRHFPYNRPVTNYPHCSFNVSIEKVVNGQPEA